MNSQAPYFTTVTGYPLTNTEKGRLGEEAFKEALLDFPIQMNIYYGEKQNDIDHLVFSGNSVIFNECKNTTESFFIWYSWFTSHVVDRFADGLPIAEYYARFLGYPIKNIVFTLTIPRLNTEPIVMKSLKGLKINVIQTGKQVLKDEDKKEWCSTVRSQILSVINNRGNNTASFSINKSSSQHSMVSANETEECPESDNQPPDDQPTLETEDNFQACTAYLSEPNTLTTLTAFLSSNGPMKKRIMKNKRTRGKQNNCKFRIIISCNQGKQFFACYSRLFQKVNDQVAGMYCGKYPNCGSCEDEAFEYAEETGFLPSSCIYEQMIDEEVTATIEASERDLRRTYGVDSQGLVWRKEGKILSMCKCKAIRASDEMITEREALTEMAKYEPCTFRCKELQKRGMCGFEERQKIKEQEAQRNLTRYFPSKRRRSNLHAFQT